MLSALVHVHILLVELLPAKPTPAFPVASLTLGTLPRAALHVLLMMMQPLFAHLLVANTAPSPRFEARFGRSFAAEAAARRRMDVSTSVRHTFN